MTLTKQTDSPFLPLHPAFANSSKEELIYNQDQETPLLLGVLTSFWERSASLCTSLPLKITHTMSRLAHRGWKYFTALFTFICDQYTSKHRSIQFASVTWCLLLAITVNPLTRAVSLLFLFQRPLCMEHYVQNSSSESDWKGMTFCFFSEVSDTKTIR